MPRRPEGNPHMIRITSTALLAGVLALGLIAGCGSDDAEESSPPATQAATDATPNTETGTDGTGEIADDGTGEIADELLDEMGEQGQTVGDAIASLPDETTWGIVADQLGDNVGVEIDGAEILLTFDEGTLDTADFDCLVAASFREEGQIVTMSYPDGDVTCT